MSRRAAIELLRCLALALVSAVGTMALIMLAIFVALIVGGGSSWAIR